MDWLPIPYPAQGATGSLNPNPTNVQGTLTFPTVADKRVRVINEGPDLAFVKFGKNAQTATTADTPVLPGQELIMQVSADSDNWAAVCRAGKTAVVQAQPLR